MPKTVNFHDPHFVYRHRLHADAMYFSAALNSLSVATQAWAEVERCNEELEKLPNYSCYVADDLGDEIDLEIEPDELSLIETLEKNSYVAYQAYIQALASTHIFCSATLEAHINSRAAGCLHGKALEQFDKLSLEGKWLFLPQLLHIGIFDPGGQPFQGVAKLIRVRNALVHHKPQSSAKKQTQFADPEGFTLTDAEESLRSVTGAVRVLAKMFKENGPWWISNEQVNFLKLDTQES